MNFRDTIRQLELFRVDLAVSLALTWPADVCEPVDHFIAIANAPSPTKDAIAIGLLSGVLAPDGGGLSGRLELTALGRLLVRRFRHCTGYRL